MQMLAKASSRLLVAAPLLGLGLGGACAPATMGAGAGARLTDPEIVAIMRTSNTGEVQTSEPAVSRATNAAGRQFAQRMITEHAAANERLMGLGIAPMENDVSRRLAQSAQETARVLQQYSGAALDRTYMDAQIRLHEYTLNTLDASLIPSARSRSLRAMLQQMRGAVAQHLEQARQIRGTP